MLVTKNNMDSPLPLMKSLDKQAHLNIMKLYTDIKIRDKRSINRVICRKEFRLDQDYVLPQGLTAGEYAVFVMCGTKQPRKQM